MIVTVPAAMPETRPVEEPMVAMAVLLLLHMPPPVASVSRVVVPTHKLEAPVIAAIVPPVTVIVIVAKQVPPVLYVMVHAPLAIPVTRPDVGLIVAIPVLELLHEPPATASLKVTVPPTLTVVVPVIAAGIALTDTV